MPVNATAGQLGLNLGLGRQTAVERLALELMERLGLSRQEALQRARAELSGRSLGLPLGEEGAAVDLEGLSTGEVAAGDTEDEDFVFGKEFPALSRDLPRPGAEAQGPIIFDDDSSLADQDSVAAKAVTGAEEEERPGGITLPPEPEVGGRPETISRILEVLGGIGAGIGKSRGIGKANKLTAQRQALSNLVNTLRGSATTGVAREEPRAGLLQTLGAGLGAGAKSFREGRGLGREERNLAARKSFEDRLARQGVERTTAQQTIENERAAAQAARDERGLVLRETAALNVKPFNVYDFKVVDGQMVRTNPVTGTYEIVVPKEIEDDVTGLQRRFEELGRQYHSLSEALDETPRLKAIFDGLKNPADKEALIGNFALGLRKFKEDLEAQTTALLGSASERLQLADVKSFRSQLDLLEKTFDNATFSSWAFTIAKAVGFGFDLEEHPKSARIFRAMDPDGEVLSGALAGFTIAIARVMNGGRPTKEDAQMAGRLLPDQGDTEETVAAKFKFLKAMFTSRETAIKNGLTGIDRPRYGETAAEFILRTLGSKQEGAEAAAANAETGTVVVDTDELVFPD